MNIPRSHDVTGFRHPQGVASEGMATKDVLGGWREQYDRMCRTFCRFLDTYGTAIPVACRALGVSRSGVPPPRAGTRRVTCRRLTVCPYLTVHGADPDDLGRR